MGWWVAPVAAMWAKTLIDKVGQIGEEEQTPTIPFEPQEEGREPAQPELLQQPELIDISQPVPQGFYGDINSPFGDPYAAQPPPQQQPAAPVFGGDFMSPFGDPYAIAPYQQPQRPMTQQEKMMWINTAGNLGNTIGRGLSSIF